MTYNPPIGSIHHLYGNQKQPLKGIAVFFKLMQSQSVPYDALKIIGPDSTHRGHLDGRIDCCQERQGGNCHGGYIWLQN